MFVLNKTLRVLSTNAKHLSNDDVGGWVRHKLYPQVYPQPVDNYVDKAPLAGRLPF